MPQSNWTSNCKNCMKHFVQANIPVLLGFLLFLPSVNISFLQIVNSKRPSMLTIRSILRIRYLVLLNTCLALKNNSNWSWTSPIQFRKKIKYWSTQFLVNPGVLGCLFLILKLSPILILCVLFNENSYTSRSLYGEKTIEANEDICRSMHLLIHHQAKNTVAFKLIQSYNLLSRRCLSVRHSFVPINFSTGGIVSLGAHML